MAKAQQVKTRYPGIYRVGDRYEWKIRGDRGMADTIEQARTDKARAEARGPSAASTRGEFGEYARTWIAGYQGRTSRGFTEGSRAGYAETLRLYVIPYFEARNLKPHQIQRQHVKAFIRWMATGPTTAEVKANVGTRRPLAAKTIRKHMAPLKAMFADAVEDGDLPLDTTRVRVNVTGAAAPSDPARPFTAEQLDAVLEAPRTEVEQLLFDTVAATGSRWGETCEWRGKDLATGTNGPVLRIRRAYSDKARDANGKPLGLVKYPKSDTGHRDLPLDPELARRLWRLQRGPEELLFTAPREIGRAHV